MAGTFTRATFYKLDTSPNAQVEYTGVVDATSPYSYRITNQASPTGSTVYTTGQPQTLTANPTIRTISPSTALSPTWPRNAGSPVTIWVQESIRSNGYLSPATSSAVVLAITNPAVSATQTFATSPVAAILHSPTLSSSGAGGTLEYWATNVSPPVYSPNGWTTTARLTLDRGERVYIGARRGVGVSTNEGQFAVYNGPFDVPFISPNLNVTVTVEKTELTGGNSSPVNISWTTTTFNTYRLLRTDSGTNVVVISLTTAGSGTLSPGGTSELPSPGSEADYKFQVRRTPVSGGDGLWYSPAGANTSFSILRIGKPTVDDTQTFNNESPTIVSHSITLDAPGIGGTLQYGWNTTGTNSQASVTNWQSSSTFNNAFTRGNTYYFYARRSTDSVDFDLSTAQTVPQIATYGLRVYNSPGTKVVFDTSTLVTNFITCKISGSASTGTTIAASSFVDVTVAGLTATNSASVFFVADGPSEPLSGNPYYSPVRNSGFVRINNPTTSPIAVTYYAGRYK